VKTALAAIRGFKKNVMATRRGQTPIPGRHQSGDFNGPPFSSWIVMTIHLLKE
jgi:hypothetical protein